MWFVMVGWEQRSAIASSLIRVGPLSFSRARMRAAARLNVKVPFFGTQRTIRADVVTRSSPSACRSSSMAELYASPGATSVAHNRSQRIHSRVPAKGPRGSALRRLGPQCRDVEVLGGGRLVLVGCVLTLLPRVVGLLGLVVREALRGVEGVGQRAHRLHRRERDLLVRQVLQHALHVALGRLLD